ncbi:Cytidylate kinase [Actinopolymorpha singaporensis]|uniref:Cytidylate kinase n=1 Tax=Actinopolymorpha singaporensis TaxID=117157 RepID=A0A1H1Q8B2_9ACTN|nr:Cytidylate kinase [Actinopolymorpha singaporensis]
MPTLWRLGTIVAVIGEELQGCVIVSGMPGAGKSTVTGLAARLLPRAARIKADDVNEMILSGRVWRLGEPVSEAKRQAELCDRNLSSLANHYVDFGFTVLLDQLVTDLAELDFLVGLMAPRPVHLVTLAPTVEVCRQRNATRELSERWEFDGYHRLEAELRQDFSDVGWWFDTSTLSPEATAEMLVREAAHRALLK